VLVLCASHKGETSDGGGGVSVPVSVVEKRKEGENGAVFPLLDLFPKVCALFRVLAEFDKDVKHEFGWNNWSSIGWRWSFGGRDGVFFIQIGVDIGIGGR
jgi:hypothetical protein